MIDSEYSIGTYKTVKINIGTVMRNPKMLNLVPDHPKTKKVYKHNFKKLPYLLAYVPEQYKTHQMCINLS